MPYLIDGHNLIARLPDIDLADPNDEAKLVNKLKGLVAKKRGRMQCTVIFDCGLPGGYSAMSTKSVQVIFAAMQVSDADSLLKLHIRRARDPKNWTVVSSDQAVLDCARAHKMKWLTSAEFVDKMAGESPAEDAPGEEVDIQITEEEVEKWMDLFGGGESRSGPAENG
ncbi:MAG: NYN domain-containing protein [Chloroflexi bacterium]|nr:NYN domain-containing protein [Chloroflexota bacterium]